MKYEKLLQEAACLKIKTFEKPMPRSTKGLYAENVIWINEFIYNSAEKSCVLAEELGHYHTTVGNILDQSKIESRKQEKQARKWAHKKLIPLQRIIDAYKDGMTNKYELAEYLEVTDDFLLEAIGRYKEELGVYTQIGRFLIRFEPLGITEIFEE